MEDDANIVHLNIIGHAVVQNPGGKDYVVRAQRIWAVGSPRPAIAHPPAAPLADIYHRLAAGKRGLANLPPLCELRRLGTCGAQRGVWINLPPGADGGPLRAGGGMLGAHPPSGAAGVLRRPTPVPRPSADTTARSDRTAVPAQEGVRQEDARIFGTAPGFTREVAARSAWAPAGMSALLL